MPPALAWWAASLELSGLSSEQAELIRQFLYRAPATGPRVRDEMGYRIATDVSARISPPPPPGVPPQYVLAAVLLPNGTAELARLRPAGPPAGRCRHHRRRRCLAPAAGPGFGPHRRPRRHRPDRGSPHRSN